MSEFDDALDAALAAAASTETAEAQTYERELDEAEQARAGWLAESAGLRLEVRDAPVRRRVLRATGRVERDAGGAAADGEAIGWPLPSVDGGVEWFLDTDANFYTYRLLTPSQMVMYLDGRGAHSSFRLAGPTVPEDDDLTAFRGELLRRVAALIPRLEGRTHPASRTFRQADGSVIDEADLPEELRARLSE